MSNVQELIEQLRPMGECDCTLGAKARDTLQSQADKIKRLEDAAERELHEVAGFVWAEACCLLYEGKDPRKHEIPELMEKVANAFPQPPEALQEPPK